MIGKIGNANFPEWQYSHSVADSQRGRLHLKDLEYILLGLNIVMSIQVLQKEVSNLGLGPTKMPKWSQKSPDFASKSQISDSTFR